MRSLLCIQWLAFRGSRMSFTVILQRDSEQFRSVGLRTEYLVFFTHQALTELVFMIKLYPSSFVVCMVTVLDAVGTIIHAQPGRLYAHDRPIECLRN